MDREMKEFIEFLVAIALFVVVGYAIFYFGVDMYTDKVCSDYQNLTGIEIKKIDMHCYDSLGVRRL